jgi:hypothetical protein
VGWHKFIPAELKEYADMAMQTLVFKAAFQDVAGGGAAPQKGL